MATITQSGPDISISTGSKMADPDAPWAMVNERFEDAKRNSEDMMDLLVGKDGTGGYLAAMKTAAENALGAVEILPPTVNHAVSLRYATTQVPVFNESLLRDLPDEVYTLQPLQAIPEIDSSRLTGALQNKPEAPEITFSWADIEYPVDVYDTLLPTILAGLTGASTGIDPDVEASLFYRARERQRIENEKLYDQLYQEWSNKQFQLPSGSLASALDDFYTALARQVQVSNHEIVILQTDLAQKHAHFIIQQAVTLEQLIRAATDAKANRSLEYEKSKATILVQVYAELIRGFVAELEAEAKYIDAQATALDGVIKSNQGKIDVYREQYVALRTRIQAATENNKSLVEVFQGQVQAYSENERGVAAHNKTQIDMLLARVQEAELELRAAIAEAEENTKRYGTLQSISERATTGMAQVAAQAVAAWVGAVSAGAHLGYSGSESISSSSSQSKSINVSHSYEHDPIS